MKNVSRITAGILAIGIPVCGFCADVTEQEVTPAAPKIYLVPQQQQAVRKIYLEPQKSVIERGAFKSLAAFTAGFDNNPHLNSGRKEDAYFQTFYRGKFETPLTKKMDGSLLYEFMNLLYADEGALDLMRNRFGGEVSRRLGKDLKAGIGYTFDSIEYIRTGHDDYIENTGTLKLEHQLPDKMFHAIQYDLSYRMYDDWKVRTSASVFGERERTDWRNTVEYSVGKFFEKDLVKLFAEFYRNDSNDAYLNYYDYDSYRMGGSVSHMFTEKISGYLSLSRQYRDYRSRTLINDSGQKENDTTYLYTTALYYTLNNSVTLGASYTYRQNNSNEPSEKYSGSLASVSTYYRF